MMPTRRAATVTIASLLAGSWRGARAQAVPALQMSVSPTMLELSGAQRAAIVDVAAVGPDAIRIQLRIRRWRMNGGLPVLEDTDEIAVSPPQAVVTAGRSQTVRVVADMVEPDAVERAYRLLVTQLPGGRASGTGVMVAMEASLPVFFAGRGTAPPRLQAAARQVPGAVELTLRNDGDSHTRLTDLVLRAGAAPVAEVRGLAGYVLARSELKLRFPTRAPVAGAATLDVTGSKGVSLRALPLRIDA
ncbi:fimbrial biogenesis chaperone [Falsiroseomonas ponticola]|uniref:fimbrial biogenesis chaperone n=1 Tax=Falsiroseomonas ponticola TaxID=2786951 RepID=UPI00193478C3|nr:fimbria/pilus periplasmic chaperone [Roseomonas ponticola]